MFGKDRPLPTAACPLPTATCLPLINRNLISTKYNNPIARAPFWLAHWCQHGFQEP